MSPNPPARRTQLAIQSPESLVQLLRSMAIANRRSVSTQVNIVLEEGLKAMKVALPADVGHLIDGRTAAARAKRK